MSPITDHEERMAACFTAHYPAIAAYFGRRCPTPTDAEDATTDVFTIAWRKVDALPPEPETRLWLFGVARRVLLQQQRTLHRRARLAERLSTTHAPPRDGPDLCADTIEALSLRDAFTALSPADREVLMLSAWDGLSPAEISRVLGIPAPVVSARLYRARRRLTRRLDPVEAITADTTDGAPSYV